MNEISLFFEVYENLPSEKAISGLARIAVGTMQVAIGVLVLPLQATGRICKNNQPYLFSRGISTISKGAKTGGVISRIAKVFLGIVQITIGAVAFPFQLCGQVFHYKQPLMVALGLMNIKNGVKQSARFLEKVLFLI